MAGCRLRNRPVFARHVRPEPETARPALSVHLNVRRRRSASCEETQSPSIRDSPLRFVMPRNRGTCPLPRSSRGLFIVCLKWLTKLPFTSNINGLDNTERFGPRRLPPNETAAGRRPDLHENRVHA